MDDPPSDQSFLFETLVDSVSKDPEKLNEAWLSMQAGIDKST